MARCCSSEHWCWNIKIVKEKKLKWEIKQKQEEYIIHAPVHPCTGAACKWDERKKTRNARRLTDGIRFAALWAARAP